MPDKSSPQYQRKKIEEHLPIDGDSRSRSKKGAGPGWASYPLLGIVAAFRTTANGIIALMLALSVATWMGVFAAVGFLFFSEIPLIFIFFGFIGPICFALMQFWGLIHIGLLSCFVYLLVHEDASRLRICAFAILPQFLCTVIVHAVMEGFYSGALLRLAILTPLVAMITFSPLIIDRIKK